MWYEESVFYQINLFGFCQVPERNDGVLAHRIHKVTDWIPHMSRLGINAVYFCPFFESDAHGYDTRDYLKLDCRLGDNEDLKAFVAKCHEAGIRVILDGVFNHTGSQSLYFNEDGFYPTVGAAQSPDSPYADWFSFHPWPTDYDAWWGIRTLPAVREESPSYIDYIIEGHHSIIRRWLRAGASGWRLDVADELPDDFVASIHQAARAEKPNAVVIGEVWEDGSTKVAYGVRRKHILGGHCDGLMNYPLRSAILSFFQGGGGEAFVKGMETIRENYPAFAFYSAMNSLDTHDTPRILTLLGAGGEYRDQSKEWRAGFTLSPKQLNKGRKLLKAAALLLFCFPGSPTVYYGDEAGMEGFEDPFNRRTYPWGEEDKELLDWFAALGKLRKTRAALRRGELEWLPCSERTVGFVRHLDGECLTVCLNAGTEPAELELPAGETVSLPPLSGVLLDGDGNQLLHT